MRIMSDYTNPVLRLKNQSLTFQHLQPLSIYSHLVCREQYGARSPLCNLQVQIPNERYKRRLDDSCLDETCETPVKKPCLSISRSPDQGCVLDFSPRASKSALVKSKDVTSPRPRVVQSVTPVMSTPVMSTPVSQCTHNRLVQAREGLPSPIPVLNWDKDVPSLHASPNVDFRNFVNVLLTGCRGDGKMVSHVQFQARESKSMPTENVAPEADVKTKVEGASESRLIESKVEVNTSTEESFEDSLPLRVQVKSKVVIPVTTRTACQPTWKQEDDIYTRARYPVQRPVLFHYEENWQRAKRTYVQSVMRHMETNGAGDGVLTELHDLMNSVAGQRHSQRPGRDASQWQHPSDLTQRNYRVRGPLLSLGEWHKRNRLDLRRFANVPDIFHRSPVL